MKTVLYVNYYASPVSMRFLDGVFRYAHEARWNVQVIDKVSENARPPLSSILPDNEQAGYDAPSLADYFLRPQGGNFLV